MPDICMQRRPSRNRHYKVTKLNRNAS
jgi:hypothetical protein